jgi:hypothetical protein
VPVVHGLPMRADYTVTAGFSARCPVTPHFTDQRGAALDPGRIAQVSVRSDAGRTMRLSPSGTTWLPCVTAAYEDSAMRKKEVQYSVQSVMISGANIVHAGVERFWPGRRYTFARWAGQRDPDQAFVPVVHGLPMRADYTVTAGFSARCPVTPHFTDQRGAALDPGRITQVSVRSDAGRTMRLSPSGTTWLPCVTAAYEDSAMRKKEVQYSVQSVMISGANIVHAGVERFWPGRTARPAVVGYFHDLTIASHDALFGAGTGTVALLTQPDHLVRRVPLGTGHSVTLSNLPQGEYRVDVKAGSAIISAQSLRLSKDQSVNLTAVSRADLATIGGVALLFVLGLPLLSGSRRRRLLGLLRRQHKEAASA